MGKSTQPSALAKLAVGIAADNQIKTSFNCETFTLPGMKKLASFNYQLEVLIVDLTESLIERPKKTKNLPRLYIFTL
ncbi:hypothetical protein NIES2100_45780 [Calothrix sp. NIES-2100]|uniref:hypothetical protein n=1 Tax=Calothrix sp. NIES-2100 TaxID=1954172 RepID=UPI000B608AD0|nr:hypothetical protein NIES2100_45780 [Calothrix sp. NIES-2100]